MAVDPAGGYWTTTWSGVVTSHGGAPTFGSPAASGIQLTKPIVGMAASPDGQGYWLVATDGGVFAYGDAQFYGSTGAIHLNQPVVGMAASPDGQGYWLVATDGGVFAYGDAQFYGSAGATHLNKPIEGIAATPDGQGYRLVASDGGVFTYGDAQFYGSLGGGTQGVLGIVVSPLTPGYALVTSDGAASVFPVAHAATKVTTPGTYTTQPYVATVTPSASQLASDCQPATPATATVDSSVTSLLANQTGPGWVAGDATYSTTLPDGREDFVFSDTLIGTAQPSGLASLTGFIHNDELVGTLPDLALDAGGPAGSPQTLIPDTTNPADNWAVSATDIENGEQLIFVNEFAPVVGDVFERYTGASGIAVMSLPANGMPNFQSIVPVPTDPQTQWGNAVVQSGDYTYIYGNDQNVDTGAFYGMKLARVALGQSLDTANWQYWNGAQWVAGEANATTLPTINQLTGVTPQPDGVGYVGVSVEDSTLATTVDLSYSCTPEGPWTTPAPAYDIPQVRQYLDELAYIPTFHPELSSTGGLVISYNIDTTSGLSNLEKDVHGYQAQFLQVDLPSS
jgi:hypothetical protein